MSAKYHLEKENNHSLENESFLHDKASSENHVIIVQDSADLGAADRQTWGRKMEYILSSLGIMVGYGNILRFPYVCIRNGGGAFLIPFFTCLVMCALPLFFLEAAMGQFISRGAVHVWCICPLFLGIGYAMIVVSAMASLYYTLNLSWNLVFLCHSFRSPLPWTLCGQSWNTNSCLPTGSKEPMTSGHFGGNSSSVQEFANVTGYFDVSNASVIVSNSRIRRPATEEFFMNNVLEISSGLEHLDGLPWHIAVSLVVAYVAIMACLFKGVKSVGKAVYVTAILPYVLITVLIINGCTLPGAWTGIKYYLQPDFRKILSFQTWVEAAIQVFYSVGPAYGGVIAYNSYNKFNNNCLRDSIFLCLASEGTSFYAGFAIFSVLGHVSHTLNVPMSHFNQSGASLAYIAYPEAISYLPVPQLWGVLFFVTLFTVGLDTLFGSAETVLTTLVDLWPRVLTKRRGLLSLAYFSIAFPPSLIFASRGGMYAYQLVDWYYAAVHFLLTGILECVVIGWIYGAERFCDDIHLMLGMRPYFMTIMWRFVTPVLLVIMFLTTLITYQPPVYYGYVYKPWAQAIGWIVACLPVVPLPICAFMQLYKAKGTFLQRLKSTCQPTEQWSPADPVRKAEYLSKRGTIPLCVFRLPWQRQGEEFEREHRPVC